MTSNVLILFDPKVIDETALLAGLRTTTTKRRTIPPSIRLAHLSIRDLKLRLECMPPTPAPSPAKAALPELPGEGWLYHTLRLTEWLQRTTSSVKAVVKLLLWHARLPTKLHQLPAGLKSLATTSGVIHLLRDLSCVPKALHALLGQHGVDLLLRVLDIAEHLFNSNPLDFIVGVLKTVVLLAELLSMRSAAGSWPFARA